MAGSANATGPFHGDGDVILKGQGARSVNRGEDPSSQIADISGWLSRPEFIDDPSCVKHTMR
jgi:hypothetical protein